jgi:hypothetical protein
MLHDHLSTYRRRSWTPPKKPLRPPSQRDLEIYKRVRIAGQFQWQVATQFQLHDSRVSQIIKNVERWLAAGGSPSDPQLTSTLAQRKLSHSLQKLRLQTAVEFATAALHVEPQPLVKTRRRIVGGTEVWREELHTDAPTVNLFALQNYLSAVKALEAFEQTDDKAPTNQPVQRSSADTLRALVDLLCRFRIEAQAAGYVDSTTDVRALVIVALQNLLGPQSVPDHAPRGGSHAQLPLNLSAAPNNAIDVNHSTPNTSDKSEGAGEGGGGPT